MFLLRFLLEALYNHLGIFLFSTPSNNSISKLSVTNGIAHLDNTYRGISFTYLVSLFHCAFTPNLISLRTPLAWQCGHGLDRVRLVRLPIHSQREQYTLYFGLRSEERR